MSLSCPKCSGTSTSFEDGKHLCDSCGWVLGVMERGPSVDPDTIPAGPELDRLVAEKVMGWKPGIGDRDAWWWNSVVGTWFRSLSSEPHEVFEEAWSPSTNIAHAWEVAEKMRHMGWAPEVWWDARAEWWCALFRSRKGDKADMLTADTAPLAICRAALKAMA